MINDEPDDLKQRLCSALGVASVELQRLPGATSSEIYRIDYSDQACVLRLFDESRWQTDTHSLTTSEAQILNALEASGLPTPSCITTLSPNGVIMQLMPGQVLLPQHPDTDWLNELARWAANIHRSDAVLPSQYTSWNDVRGARPPDWWPDESLWIESQALLSSPPEFATIPIHRDYHPLNVLWEGARTGGQISGIVDWINGCMGPGAVDVAHCRLNLALMYNITAADEFLGHYCTYQPGYRHHPYWDVDDAFSILPEPEPYAPWKTFGLPALTIAQVRTRLVKFIRHALQQHNRESSI